MKVIVSIMFMLGLFTSCADGQFASSEEAGTKIEKEEDDEEAGISEPVQISGAFLTCTVQSEEADGKNVGCNVNDQTGRLSRDSNVKQDWFVEDENGLEDDSISISGGASEEFDAYFKVSQEQVQNYSVGVHIVRGSSEETIKGKIQDVVIAVDSSFSLAERITFDAHIEGDMDADFIGGDVCDQTGIKAVNERIAQGGIANAFVDAEIKHKEVTIEIKDGVCFDNMKNDIQGISAFLPNGPEPDRSGSYGARGFAGPLVYNNQPACFFFKVKTSTGKNIRIIKNPAVFGGNKSNTFEKLDQIASKHKC